MRTIPPQGVDLTWAAGSAASDQPPKLVVTNRGLVLFNESGEAHSSRLRCNEALEVPTSLPPTVLARADGSLLAGTYQGVYVSADSACSLTATSGVPAVSLSPVIVGSDAWLLTTRTVDVPSKVFASTDEGATWSERYAGEPGGYLDCLIRAPSRPERMYASGLVLGDGGRSSLCAVSDDGGRSFTHKTRVEEITPFAVHPDNPDIVFAYEFANVLGTSFRVLRSTDACDTFTSVLEGLTVAPSGLVGNSGGPLFLGVAHAGGLYRSDDQGQSFNRVAPEQVQSVTCLVQRASRLWLCANFAPNSSGIWYTDDQGASFQKFLTFDEVVGPVACDSAEQRTLCATPWYDYYTELHPEGARGNLDSGVSVDAAVAPSDAGDTAGKHAGGCQIGARGARGEHAAWGLMALGLFMTAGLGARRR